MGVPILDFCDIDAGFDASSDRMNTSVWSTTRRVKWSASNRSKVPVLKLQLDLCGIDLFQATRLGYICSYPDRRRLAYRGSRSRGPLVSGAVHDRRG
ncbi:unnamed protein product [Calypogeia fissa]